MLDEFLKSYREKVEFTLQRASEDGLSFSEGDREGEYYISGSNFTYRIELTSKMVGYELTVGVKDNGPSLGAFRDTDLYPLSDDPGSGLEKDICDEMLAILNQTVSRNIYFLKQKSKGIIAIGNGDDYKVKVITKRRFFSMNVEHEVWDANEVRTKLTRIEF